MVRAPTYELSIASLEQLHSCESKANSQSITPYAVAEDSHMAVVTGILALTRTRDAALSRGAGERMFVPLFLTNRTWLAWYGHQHNSIAKTPYATVCGPRIRRF